MIPEFCILLGCPALFFLLPIINVGLVLIFQLGPGHGTEALFPVVPRYRFWHLGPGTSVLAPRFWFLLLDTRVSALGFQGVTCIFLILVLVPLHFGTISAPNQVELKALVLEPNLTGT